MQTHRFFLLLLLLLALAVVAGCGGGGGGKTDSGVSVTISPVQVILSLEESCQFTATVNGTSNTGVIWSVSPEGGGSVTAAGLYTAQSAPGTYYVKATSKADPAKSAQATVTVVSGAASGNKYTGRITIENTGTMDNLTMNQSATLEVVLGSPGAPFTQYDNSFFSALVSASINDTTGEDPVVTVTGSLINAVVNSPDLVVVLEINETTYDLFIGPVLVDCDWTGGGISFPQRYFVLGREVEEYLLPADKSRLTGSVTAPAQDSEVSGVTQKITWDLVLTTGDDHFD